MEIRIESECLRRGSVSMATSAESRAASRLSRGGLRGRISRSTESGCASRLRGRGRGLDAGGTEQSRLSRAVRSTESAGHGGVRRGRAGRMGEWSGLEWITVEWTDRWHWKREIIKRTERGNCKKIGALFNDEITKLGMC